jgi:4-hydroxybenzoate polyprenyltransferase/phosphoserine phosphatase
LNSTPSNVSLLRPDEGAPAASLTTATRAVPLCVDLDGTLLHTDTLWETAILQLKARPWRLLAAPAWLLAGRARLKDKLAAGVSLDCASLPFTAEFIEYLRRERATGREIVLVSACARRVGEQIAAHLGLFDEVITSDTTTNLKGPAKARVLVQRYGEGGFDYAGNEATDLPVWAAARERIAVNAPMGLVRQMRRSEKPLRTFAPSGGRLKATIKALRCHQWCKNVLVFVPIITAHAYFNRSAVLGGLAMFAAWCLVASGIYVTNDLLDLEADRRHPSKRNRPFASGALPISVGLALGPALLLAGTAVAASLSTACAIALLSYIAVSTAYSFHLKKRPLVDVFTLAFLFTIRVVGGGVASGYPVTMWLLAFTIFLFLGLAFLKRCSELVRIQALGRRHLGSRGYGVVDLVTLQMFGIASAFVAIVVFALYLNSTVAEAQYRWPAALFGVAPCLLLWLCRLWLATGRGEMHDDPIVYSMKDRVSWAVGAGVLAVYVVATLGKTPFGIQ